LEIGQTTKKYRVTLDPAKHESYIREIMEKGGAPNLAELFKIASAAEEKSQTSVLL
jgi:hypothetical protein